jgi:hypothetical protein
VGLTLLLGLGRGALGWLTKVPLWVYAALAVLIWGAVGYHQAANLKREKQAAAVAAMQETSRLEAQARAKEKQDGIVNQAVTDSLVRSMARAATERSASEQRLRAVAAAWAASQASGDACAGRGGDGAPTVAVLSESVRGDLDALVADADTVAGRLSACQRYIREVVKP